MSSKAGNLAHRSWGSTAGLWCTIVHNVLVEWDSTKARSNFRKHGIHFADAVAVLEDERASTIMDDLIDDESRWITMGLDAFGRVLVVVYTWRGERVRFISARKSTAKERRQYEQGYET